MTDEVGRLVLEDNVDQNILLLNDRMRVADWSPSYERLMDWLEKSADLKRDLEALPSTETLRERLSQGQGLTSPELSVLAAYAKIELASALRDSDLADDPWFRGTLRAYFPQQLRERFDAELDTHPLRREIIATVVANDMINLGGITFAFRTMEETSATEVAVAKAFVALREIFDLNTMVGELNSLPASFPTEHWSTVHLDIRRLLDRAVRWLLAQGGTSRPSRTPWPSSSRSWTRCGPGSWTTCVVMTVTALRTGWRPRVRGNSRSGLPSGGRSSSRALSCWTSPRSCMPARSRWRRLRPFTTQCSTASTLTRCWNGSAACRARTGGRHWPGPHSGMTSIPPSRT
ncbi:NAD-specific glutamate dehydrogenase [Arthrobacter sp. Hiyo4]|nr:NAD-specific glutamate dehydrogenase [Arthrobacter sp. Hiyo4]